MHELPVLYSFRRCPYAMRARLAIASAEFHVELREVVLRDKPEEMLAVSPKGTVPVLVLPDGTVLEESRDIMEHALAVSDPEGMLDFPQPVLDEMRLLADRLDGPFKSALDRYKYPDRHEDADPLAERERAGEFVHELDARLAHGRYLHGERVSFADLALWPFIRQFAHVDKEWFRSQDWKSVVRWLDEFLAGGRLDRIFARYPKWESGQAGVKFPPENRA